jgi:hypothetical protein
MGVSGSTSAGASRARSSGGASTSSSQQQPEQQAAAQRTAQQQQQNRQYAPAIFGGPAPPPPGYSYQQQPPPYGAPQPQQRPPPGYPGGGPQPQPLPPGAPYGPPRPAMQPQQQQQQQQQQQAAVQQHVTYLTPEQLQSLFLTGHFPGGGGPGGAFFSPYGVLPHMVPPLPPPRVEHAQTIRNDINVKKGTLRLLEEAAAAAVAAGGGSASGGKRLFLEFTFDAAAPCAITVLFAAEEVGPKPAGVPLTACFRPTPPAGAAAAASSRALGAAASPPCLAVRRVFPKGLGQRYSQAVGYGGGGSVPLPASAGVDPAATSLGWINPAAYTQEQLTAVGAAVPLRAGAPPLRQPGSSHVPPQQQVAHPYPIAIVLEAAVPGEVEGDTRTVTPDPATGYYSFAVGSMQQQAEAVAAAAAAGRVQLQVTYATLVYHAVSGSSAATAAAAAAAAAASAADATSPPPGPLVPCHAWSVRPLKQKIAVDADRVYELREIYGVDGGAGGGGSSAAAAASAAGDGAAGGSSTASAGAGVPAEGAATPGGGDTPVTAAGGERDAHTEGVLSSTSECVICLTDARDTTVIPCRHMCLCYECALQLRLNTNRCPICRACEWHGREA